MPEVAKKRKKEGQGGVKLKPPNFTIKCVFFEISDEEQLGRDCERKKEKNFLKNSEGGLPVKGGG